MFYVVNVIGKLFGLKNARFGIAKRKKVMENTRLFQVLYIIARKCS